MSQLFVLFYPWRRLRPGPRHQLGTGAPILAGSSILFFCTGCDSQYLAL